MTISAGYKGNALLKKIGTPISFTAQQLAEFIKCSNDPIYFINTYYKTIHVDKGLIQITLRSYQEEMVNSFHKNRRTIVTTSRRSGKSTAVCGYLLWYIIFNSDKTVALLANKGDTARELLSLIQLAYQYLPLWLQQGVKEFNKGSFVLENNSRIIAAATASDALRGYTISFCFIDEAAFIDNWETFSTAVLPTITSGLETKLVLVSTPNGLNHYHDYWQAALKKDTNPEEWNGYFPIKVTWQEVPGNDENWYKETLAMLNNDIVKFNQEYNVEFLGSTNTLISAAKLGQMFPKNPRVTEGLLDIYEPPKPGRTYVMTVDVSEGLNKDYSAFSIIDVTELPYQQVAKYRNNEIQPFLFPTIIYTTATRYNDAFVLVEINSIGLQVADILHYELNYDNLIKIQMKGKQGQQFTAGHNRRMAFGLKQTPQTKKIGCANLKTLIETDKLIVVDKVTIDELKVFSEQKNSFSAEEGKNDDMAMTLVNFGWLAAQKYFKDNIKNDIRKALQEEMLQIMDEDITPFGKIDNHIDDPDGKQPLKAGDDYWVQDRQSKYPFDNLDWDWRYKM